jgi:hypothetical protein
MTAAAPAPCGTWAQPNSGEGVWLDFVDFSSRLAEKRLKVAGLSPVLTLPVELAYCAVTVVNQSAETLYCFSVGLDKAISPTCRS